MSNLVMAVGVDFGFEGGLVALDENRVVMASKTPVMKLPVREGESDLKWRKDSKSQSKAAKKKPRYIKTGELKPRISQVYDTPAIVDLLGEVQRCAVLYGYIDLVLAIESPQMVIGKSHPNTYFASGRGQNAWLIAAAQCGIEPLFFSPKHWKSTLGLDEDKSNSLTMAERVLELNDTVRGDHDLCEAALLAYFVQTHASRYLTYG